MSKSTDGQKSRNVHSHITSLLPTNVEQRISNLTQTRHFNGLHQFLKHVPDSVVFPPDHRPQFSFSSKAVKNPKPSEKIHHHDVSLANSILESM